MPKTDFPMKGNLSILEPKILDKWRELRINERISEPKPDRPTFILHDGPPYANGDIHLGHTLNKVLKDIIVRSRTMNGFYSPYVPGWDCHGQPIEHEVEKRLGKKKGEITKTEIRRLCREYALNFVSRQREQFERLGVGGMWDRPYLTLDPVYEATNVKVFNQLYQKGLIYKGRKPIHWCYRCKTALAEAEIEYEDEASPSIYVKFPLATEFGILKEPRESVSLLIWTTTPWTLPANVAVAVNPEAEYAAVRDGSEVYIMADALIGDLSSTISRDLEKIKTFAGKELLGLSVGHPTKTEVSQVVGADFVALDQGTGCVHIAPGHGEEDYSIGLKYNLPSPMPVNEDGVFTDEAGRFAGLHIKKANEEIIEDLRKRGLMLWSGSIDHSYPHCWRCKEPVIFRATEQWFISMEAGDLRDRALNVIESVKWIPDWSIRRISGMISERPDWCISRQRAWGVPVPVFYCRNCGKVLATSEVLNHVETIFADEGADVWFEKKPDELLPENTVCEGCSGREFETEDDILDVWFESGVSHAAVLETRPELSWPADMYLEGSDQHRGWFQSSLMTAVGTRGAAPYKQVLTHGFLVDGEGRKMSKSRGNVVDPLKVIKRSGADLLRLWVCSADYGSDIAVSGEILDRISEAYRRIRNTIRFMLGSIGDFDPEKDRVDCSGMERIDKWALMRFNELIKKVQEAYKDYRLHIVYHSVYNFCAVDMSAFYLDVLKDRLYTSAKDAKSRRSAQTVIYEIVKGLVKLLSPVLVFTADEAWSYMPLRVNVEQSVHLTQMPVENDEYFNLELKDEWDKLIVIRQEVLKALEAARMTKLIGGSLEAKIKLYVPGDLSDVVGSYAEELSAIFIVSQVETEVGGRIPESAWSSETVPGLALEVDHAKGEKCARCWNWRIEVGSDERHKELCDRCLKVVGA